MLINSNKSEESFQSRLLKINPTQSVIYIRMDPNQSEPGFIQIENINPSRIDLD